MSKKNIYVAQFGTGSNINLLPLAAGQLVSRLKKEKELLRECQLCEMLFRRPEDTEKLVDELEDVFIIGFSCFLWNMNISLKTADVVRKKFPEALIIAGGPSIPKETELLDDFFREHPCVDVICTGEGEDVFVALCQKHLRKESFEDIPGIICRNRKTGAIHQTAQEETVVMDDVSSPYLDGTFDEFYRKYKSEFSGIIWETNRGCPFQCSFCTLGNRPAKIIRDKPMDQIKEEIGWMGKNQITYIAMTDANFGIRKRDTEIAGLLVKCKQEFGCPDFISVNWAKHSTDNVLEVANILSDGGIGFRITQSLQSTNHEVLKAIKRMNIQPSVFQRLRETYSREHYYTYTELILGLPLETYESYIDGIEQTLSESVYEQLYLYCLFLFPNTQMASLSSREKYGIESKMVPLRYAKSKIRDNNRFEESVEMVIGTKTMPKDKWVDAFVVGYYTFALHDNRLAFFVLRYLKRNFGIKITQLISYARDVCKKCDLKTLRKSFAMLEHCARDVQEKGSTHLIEPALFDGIPHDPSEAIFFELLMEREGFYQDFSQVVKSFLKSQEIDFDHFQLDDLFLFQESIMAHPDGPQTEDLELAYDWANYFLFTYHLPATPLQSLRGKFRVIDSRPSGGDPITFLKNYFDVRGVPAFNELCDAWGNVVFPPESSVLVNH